MSACRAVSTCLLLGTITKRVGEHFKVGLEMIWEFPKIGDPLKGTIRAPLRDL